MGRRKDHRATKSQTLPSSPTHSSSSSDFEFTVALTPRGAANSSSSSYSSAALCPADELFYKGQLLPLHLSPRLSMVRTLLLASSSTSSSSDTTTTASRDSTGSSSNDSRSSFSAADLLLLPPDCDSSRPSSAAEETDFSASAAKKTSKYHFSLSRFSSVFRKPRHPDPPHPTTGSVQPTPSPVKRLSKTAREVIGKYLKKVKPLYEKLSQNQKPPPPPPQHKTKSPPEPKETAVISHSFSGNLRYPRRKSCVSSCPSSMRSSPSHSGVLCRAGFTPPPPPVTKSAYPSDMSSMEELQSAIQGAIAHCKNSMLQPPTTTATSSNKNIVVSNEI
ncbi:PREDICTED: probable membrane-associated kinase regulator 1 [Ipomoea nil]|uniref:probable membrane-associated kinase regulator 1 n=1 Tax=Ipomoea nil TaxID=35883 RepID=UPI000900BCFE|nr:PREDICTED: probable membrane-associated kinase regulator 1 [Ipomoea nil]